MHPLEAAAMADHIWYIKNCRLFEQLASEQLARLEQRARVRRFPKGTTIYLPSDAGNVVFLLAEGRVKLSSITPEGKQAILAFIEPGEIFGELAILEEAEREEHAEAMIASTLVLLPGDAVEQLMSESAGLALGVTKLIGLRRKRIERRLKSLLFRSNRDRLIHLLLDLSSQYGKPDQDGTLLAIPLSHQDLASIIGATRETVTTLLGELQLERLLKVARQRLVIRDVGRLAACIELRPSPPPKQQARPVGTAKFGRPPLGAGP
jgi:CRP-like cAMP-binding protein